MVSQKRDWSGGSDVVLASSRKREGGGILEGVVRLFGSDGWQPSGSKSVGGGGDLDVAASGKLGARVWRWRFCCGGLQRIGSMAADVAADFNSSEMLSDDFGLEALGP